MTLDGDSFFATVSAPCQRPMRLNADMLVPRPGCTGPVLSRRLASQSMQWTSRTNHHHERISAILLEGRCEGDMEPLNWGILQTSRGWPHPRLAFHGVCKPCGCVDIDE